MILMSLCRSRGSKSLGRTPLQPSQAPSRWGPVATAPGLWRESQGWMENPKTNGFVPACKTEGPTYAYSSHQVTLRPFPEEKIRKHMGKAHAISLRRFDNCMRPPRKKNRSRSCERAGTK